MKTLLGHLRLWEDEGLSAEICFDLDSFSLAALTRDCVLIVWNLCHNTPEVLLMILTEFIFSLLALSDTYFPTWNSLSICQSLAEQEFWNSFSIPHRMLDLVKLQLRNKPDRTFLHFTSLLSACCLLWNCVCFEGRRLRCTKLQKIWEPSASQQCI